MRRFDLVLPDSLEDCLKILAERGRDTKLVAGGTDLLPAAEERPAQARAAWWTSRGSPELRAIEAANGRRLRIGAAVTARELELDARVRAAFLGAGRERARWSARSRCATWRRSAATSAMPRRRPTWRRRCWRWTPRRSSPGPSGRARACRWPTFFTGVRRTVLAPDELLVEIVVPAPGARSGGNYLRHTPRRELDIAVVGVASQLTLADGSCTKARIALAAVAPMPLRATAAEQALEGQAVTPERDRAGRRARGRAPRAHRRSARLDRVPQATWCAS